jgi:activator of 2-hydroxyglutaryl-CoA dehydratase
MNAVRLEYKDILKENKIDLDLNKFQSIHGGKYQKAILTLIIQLKMSGQLKDAQSLKELMKEEIKGESSYMTATEFLDAIGAAVGANIDDMLVNNEYEIMQLKESEKSSAEEMFKQFNVLVQERFVRAAPNKQVQTSMLAVRSILSAA